MANSIKQRLTAIRVREISLVDRPANEIEFVVVKRQEEETGMSKTGDQQVADVAVQEPKGNAEAASTPTSMDGMQDLTKQVEALAALLQPKVDPPADETPHVEGEAPVAKAEVEGEGPCMWAAAGMLVRG